MRHWYEMIFDTNAFRMNINGTHTHMNTAKQQQQNPTNIASIKRSLCEKQFDIWMSSLFLRGSQNLHVNESPFVDDADDPK